MANDFEKRLGKLEDRFDEYMAMFYRWLDGLHVDHEESKRRIAQNEETLREVKETLKRSDETLSHVVEIQHGQGEILSGIIDVKGNVLKLLDRMDQKIDTLLNRSSNGKH